MRRLTTADYRVMPWANGRGTTVEMLREDGPEGLLLRPAVTLPVELYTPAREREFDAAEAELAATLARPPRPRVRR